MKKIIILITLFIYSIYCNNIIAIHTPLKWPKNKDNLHIITAKFLVTTCALLYAIKNPVRCQKILSKTSSKLLLCTAGTTYIINKSRQK